MNFLKKLLLYLGVINAPVHTKIHKVTTINGIGVIVEYSGRRPSQLEIDDYIKSTTIT